MGSGLLLLLLAMAVSARADTVRVFDFAGVFSGDTANGNGVSATGTGTTVFDVTTEHFMDGELSFTEGGSTYAFSGPPSG